MKILITGYSRSGTTLLRHLIRGHKHVKHILHETMILTANRGLVGTPYTMWAWFGLDPIVFRFDSDKETWGEKIVYDYPCLDYGVVNAFDYCLFWNEMFMPDARIVNIVRSPFDVVISSSRKKKVSIARATEIYKWHMPKVHYEINSLSNVKTFKFEDLLFLTEITLEAIFEHCGIDSSRGAIKEAISRAKPDMQNNRINSKIAFKYEHDEDYPVVSADEGLKSISEILGY